MHRRPLPGLFTVVIILGGILSGVVHRHRIAAIACVWAFLVTMFYLPRLQVESPADPGAPHRQDGHHRDDPDRLRRLPSATS
jgi:hypothetical protein